MPLQYWIEKGWIYEKIQEDGSNGIADTTWEEDYQRRIQDRLKRWKAMRRHIGQYIKGVKKGDLDCRKKQETSTFYTGHMIVENIN